MASAIDTLRTGFGKFTESLPDELFSEDARVELGSLNARLIEVMNDDFSFIKSLANSRKAYKSILNKMLQSRSQFIKKAFIRYKEHEEVNKDPLGYFISQWLLCKGTLERIPSVMLEELQNTQQMNIEYSQPGADSHSKRSAYIRFTRAYQAFLGCAVNILDVIDEYDDFFNRACKRMDPNYYFNGISLKAWLYEDEIITGAYELLLRANMGRYTCVPLIRSAIEIQLIRLLLEPPVDSQLFGSKLIPIGRFDIMEFLTKHSVTLGITLNGIDEDALTRLYDWGSVSLHRGWRMNHCEMWYALNIAESITGFVQINKAMFKKNYDNVISGLVKVHQIKIEAGRAKARKTS